MKYLIILFSLMLFKGCSTTSDGGKVIGLKGSRAWWNWAPEQDKLDYLSTNENYELCALWDRRYDQSSVANREIRSTISKLLIQRGEDPMLCRNPELDRANILDDRVREAERKAAAAERKARKAKREAEAAERKARQNRDW